MNPSMLVCCVLRRSAAGGHPAVCVVTKKTARFPRQGGPSRSLPLLLILFTSALSPPQKPVRVFNRTPLYVFTSKLACPYLPYPSLSRLTQSDLV